MTGRGVIRVEADGTRVYSSYNRYRPKPLHERKIGVNKPDDPRAMRFHGVWLLPIETIDDEERVMPETRPDDEAYDHMEVSALCNCYVCRRPAADRWRKKWRKDNGLRP